MYSKRVICCFVLAIFLLTVISFLAPYARAPSSSPFLNVGLHYQQVTIRNNQEHVEGPFDLHCRGYNGHNYTTHRWSAAVTVKPRSNVTITFPLVRFAQTFEVYCTYRGGDGCWAHKILLFTAPGTDNFFCNNRRDACVFDFQSDGGVSKMYDGVETTFQGYVPTEDNVKEQCWGFVCVPNFFSLVIGEDSCCDSSCRTWDPLP